MQYTRKSALKNGVGVYKIIILYDDFTCFVWLIIRRNVMKKSYLTPSIMVVNYNQVDIVTASINDKDYTTIKGSWIENSWLGL